MNRRLLFCCFKRKVAEPVCKQAVKQDSNILSIEMLPVRMTFSRSTCKWSYRRKRSFTLSSFFLGTDAPAGSSMHKAPKIRPANYELRAPPQSTLPLNFSTSSHTTQFFFADCSLRRPANISCDQFSFKTARNTTEQIEPDRLPDFD
jgi:hypothetical protein